LSRLKAPKNRIEFRATLYSLGVANVEKEKEKTRRAKNSEPESTRETRLKAAGEDFGVKQGFYEKRDRRRETVLLKFEGSPVTASEKTVWRAALERVREEGTSQRTTYEILVKLAEGATLGLKDQKWINGHKSRFANALKGYESTTWNV
jgi:hypothetical protein